MSTPVAIEITARLDKFREEMAKIPDIGGKEAKALTAQLSREIKAAGKAAEDAAKKSKGFKDETRGFVDAAGAAGQGAKKLRGLVSELGGEYGALLAFVDDTGDAVEVFGDILGLGAGVAGVAAVAIAGLAVAYKLVTADIERAEATSESLKRTHDTLIPTERSLRDAQLELAVAVGTVTEEMAKQEAARNAARDAVLDFGEAQQKEREELRKSAESAQAWIDVIDTVGLVDPLGLKPLAADLLGLNDTIEQSKTRTDALNDALVTEATNQKNLRETTIAGIKAKEDDAKATGKQTQALQAQLSIEEQIRLLREKVAQEAEDRRADVYAKESADALAGAELMRKVEEQQTEDARKAAEERVKIAEDEAERQKQIDREHTQAAADLAGAIASIAQTAGENLSEEQKEQALTLFAIQKAAAMAQAAINTVLAISEASTLPYPANIPAMAAAGAVGLAQEVAIAAQPAPSFNDTPAMMEMGQSGTVRLAAGDKFAASQTAEGLRAQVGASDPGADYRDGGNYAIVGARAYGRRITDDVRQRTPLSGVLSGRRDRPLGQRA